VILKAIIIDDESKAIDLLENYCERIPTIQYMKSFRNPIEAYNIKINNNLMLYF